MRSRAGFTLVELLVSMAVGMIVLLLAASSLRSAGAGYGRNTDGVSADREARAALTQLADDMAKGLRDKRVVIETVGNEWKLSRFGFLCLQPDDAQAEAERVGDVCAVIYYVRDLEVGGNPVRCLMRGFRGSNEVFGALRQNDIASLYDDRAPDEPVAFGVVSFEISPLVRSGQDWVPWTEPSDWDDPFVQGPEAVKVSMVVARRELVAKLGDATDWDSSPMLGRASEVARSNQLETYEGIHPFSRGL